MSACQSVRTISLNVYTPVVRFRAALDITGLDDEITAVPVQRRTVEDDRIVGAFQIEFATGRQHPVFVVA